MFKPLYTSVTETVARILSLLITLLCFSIYILSKDTQLLLRVDWAMLVVHLLVFWLAYEVFSFCFFLLLQQFAAIKELKTNQVIPKIQTNPMTDIDKPAEPKVGFDK